MLKCHCHSVLQCTIISICMMSLRAALAQQYGARLVNRRASRSNPLWLTFLFKSGAVSWLSPFSTHLLDEETFCRASSSSIPTLGPKHQRLLQMLPSSSELPGPRTASLLWPDPRTRRSSAGCPGAVSAVEDVHWKLKRCHRGTFSAVLSSFC